MVNYNSKQDKPGCRQPGFATSTDSHFTSGVVDSLYLTPQREVRNQIVQQLVVTKNQAPFKFGTLRHQPPSPERTCTLIFRDYQLLDNFDTFVSELLLKHV